MTSSTTTYHQSLGVVFHYGFSVHVVVTPCKATEHFIRFLLMKLFMCTDTGRRRSRSSPKEIPLRVELPLRVLFCCSALASHVRYCLLWTCVVFRWTGCLFFFQCVLAKFIDCCSLYLSYSYSTCLRYLVLWIFPYACIDISFACLFWSADVKDVGYVIVSARSI